VRTKGENVASRKVSGDGDEASPAGRREPAAQSMMSGTQTVGFRSRGAHRLRNASTGALSATGRVKTNHVRPPAVAAHDDSPPLLDCFCAP